MKFCPVCGNLLLVDCVEDVGMRLFCQSCPYIYHITESFTITKKLKKKEVDDVLGAEAWDNVQQTTSIVFHVFMLTIQHNVPNVTMTKRSSCSYRPDLLMSQ